jgi:hypothetical protein
MIKIRSIEQVIQLAQDRKSVLNIKNGQRIPAAIMQNWQAVLLYRSIQSGRFVEYVPKKKEPLYKAIKKHV